MRLPCRVRALLLVLCGPFFWPWTFSWRSSGRHAGCIFWTHSMYTGCMSRPMNLSRLVGWTPINPSYFDVNKRATFGFDPKPYSSFILPPKNADCLKHSLEEIGGSRYPASDVFEFFLGRYTHPSTKDDLRGSGPDSNHGGSWNMCRNQQRPGGDHRKLLRWII